VPLSYRSVLVLTHEPHDAQVEVFDVDSLPKRSAQDGEWLASPAYPTPPKVRGGCPSIQSTSTQCPAAA
jgi:hypothetical protein